MRFSFILLAAILALYSCNSSDNSGKISADAQRAVKTKATRFSLEEKDDITRLVINDPWQNASGEQLVFYLVPHGEVIPAKISPENVIRVPVSRMICMSTTHLAALSALGATDVIAGASGTNLVYDASLRKSIEEGIIPDVGYEGSLDRELIVALRPDLLMAYGVSASSSEQMRKMSDMGVKVIFNADYLEEHPLARCEWIKIFGLLTGKKEKADSLYSAVTENYLRLAEMVRDSSESRPAVLLGAPWEDVWYISPSNSYIGSLISDAGGQYLFDDLTAPNSLPFAVEAVFRRATRADVWINPGTAGSLDEIAEYDHRMTKLAVYKSGSVWNNRNRMTPAGGNDYWETAVVRPDLLLSDLISILHPRLLPDHELWYFMKLK
ncbi:MAG: ABC transporter substrate-binding protein [Bacteroidales bacterium]|nr:ABC transporter substrate-binding protein [Bacteroidales bacterium]